MAGPSLLTLRKWTYRRLGQNASLRSTDAAQGNHVDNPNYPLADVDEAINDALQNIVLRLDHDFFKTSDTVNAVDGEVAVPSGFGNRLQLSYRASSSESWSPLKSYTEEQADINMANWRTVAGVTRPTGFFVKAKSDGTVYYRLLPTLASTTTNGLFRRYTNKVTTLSLITDTADILQFFGETAIVYVPCRAAAMLDTEPEEGRMQLNNQMAEEALILMNKKLNALTANGLSNYRRR